MGAAPVVNYEAIESERLQELQASIAHRLQQTKDWGFGDSLRQVVLTSVVKGSYQRASEQLDEFISSKSAYPNFAHKVSRYVSHSRDLVRAIEGKRNFAGLGALPLAKQQEIYDRVVDHFEELKAYLKKIEIIEKETRLEDIRSTTWLIKAVMNALIAIFAVGLYMDIAGGLGETFNTVFSSVVTEVVDKSLKFVGM